MTVAPRAIKVALLVRPAPVGVADPPVIVIVLPEPYNVVPLVPSNATSEASNAFTDATNKDALVMTTLPEIDISVEPNVNVVNAAVPLIIETLPNDTIAGKVNVANEPMVVGAIAPPINVNAGGDNVVIVVMALGAKLPPTVANAGMETVLLTVGAKLPTTVVRAGNDNVAAAAAVTANVGARSGVLLKSGTVKVKLPPTVVKAAKLTEVTEAAVGTLKSPPTVVKAANENDVTEPKLAG